jgi:hypothetical protein
MITQKGFISFLMSVILGLLFSPSLFGAYNAPVDYKQTMTIVVRETDVDDWLPTYSRYFEETAVSPSGSKIAFITRLAGYKDKHLYLANGDGTGLVDMTSHLPSGINVNNVYYLQFCGDGSKLFFFGNYGADVVYCDVLTVNKQCNTAFAGPIYGDARKPFTLDNGGTKLFFKHNTGWDSVAKKYRQGLFWASVGYPAVELMNIDQLPGSQNMNLLRYLGSSESGTLLFTWLNSTATYPAQTSMYKVGLGSGPSRMPSGEVHQYVWDAQNLNNRLINTNGTVALYAHGEYGQPTELHRLDLWYGTKRLILKTTDGNGFHGGPALSPSGSIARVHTIGYNQTRIRLSDMTTRDTHSYWFSEAGCISNLTDITENDRLYYMGSACWSGDPAKIFRLDMTPNDFGKGPNITAITFNSRYLPFDDNSTLTITANVKKAVYTKKAIEWVKMKSLVEGREAPEWLVYEPLSYDAFLYDDGSHGDAAPGDGIYTNNTIHTNSGSNFYKHFTLPHYIGVRVIAKDVDDNYVMADTHLTVSKDPLPTAWITVSDPNAGEPGDPGTLFVHRKSTDSTEDSLTIKYTVSGSATKGTDYYTLPGTVTIGAGNLAAGITVRPKDDNLMEGLETVTVTLTPDAAYIVGSPAAATVNISSDENVTIVATDPIATEEGPTTGYFTVRRTGSTAAPLVVDYTVGGTATPGSDYVALPGSVTIPADKSAARIMVTPKIDNVTKEGNETVVVTLTEKSNYTLGTAKRDTVTIINNYLRGSDGGENTSAVLGGSARLHKEDQGNK